MASNHQNTEEFSANLLALITWVQAMPRSILSIPKTDDVVEQPKLIAEFNSLKDQVAQLKAQVKEITAVVDGLQASVEILEWDYHRYSPNGNKRRVSSEDDQLKEPCRLPAYISALKKLQPLSGQELQQMLKNFNLEWSGLGPDEMKRAIMKHLGFGHYLEEDLEI